MWFIQVGSLAWTCEPERNYTGDSHTHFLPLPGPLAMVRKGHGKVTGKPLAAHAGTKRIADKIHACHRQWSDLPATIMVCILASLPGKHRRSRISLAHMTLAEIWADLKTILRLKPNQFLPARDTQQVIMDAMLQSYTLQHIPIPQV